MTDQLSLYNGALRHVKQRRLATLTDASEPRRLLDDVWNDGARNFVLEQGEWKFATRTGMINYTPSVEPPFGYRFAFAKPSDWVRTVAVASDEYFRVPLNEMSDEAGFFFSDLQQIYVRWVSNNTSYGLDYSKWPQSFTLYVECYLAWLIAPRLLKGKSDVDDIEERMTRYLTAARSKDALNGPTAFPPPGSWTSARIGRQSARRSLWNGNTL